MTDDILALYYMTCSEMVKHMRSGNTDAVHAAFAVTADLWSRMTDEERQASFEIEDEGRRLIDERLANG